MTWRELFHMLWQADWSAEQIAEAYATTDERVRTLIGSHWVTEFGL